MYKANELKRKMTKSYLEGWNYIDQFITLSQEKKYNGYILGYGENRDTFIFKFDDASALLYDGYELTTFLRIEHVN